MRHFRRMSPCHTSAQLLRGHRAADASPAYAATIARTVYKSSFCASKEVCETSHGPKFNFKLTQCRPVVAPPAGRQAETTEYCDERVCGFVCRTVSVSISEKSFAHVACREAA